MKPLRRLSPFCPTLLFIPLSGMPQMMTGGRPKSDLKRIIDEVLMGK